jgi:glyoxylase-like metal-dependent hydrolase (beta-lactamase superfamily II)
MVVAKSVGDVGVFDTGVEDFMPEALLPALNALGETFARITAICSTHGHFDHSGGSRALRDVSGGRIYFSPSDADLAGFTPDVQLHGGECIRIGSFSFEVVATPGHTKGSVCFYEPSLRLVITGDAVQGSGSAANGLLPVYFHSGREYRTGLRTLLGLRPNILVMGHPLEWSGVSRCVHRGDACRALLHESLRASEVIAAAVAAVQQDAESNDLPTLRHRILSSLTNNPLFREFDPDGTIGASTDATLLSELRDLGTKLP